MPLFGWGYGWTEQLGDLDRGDGYKAVVWTAEWTHFGGFLWYYFRSSILFRFLADFETICSVCLSVFWLMFGLFRTSTLVRLELVINSKPHCFRRYYFQNLSSLVKNCYSLPFIYEHHNVSCANWFLFLLQFSLSETSLLGLYSGIKRVGANTSTSQSDFRFFLEFSCFLRIRNW